MNKVIGKSLCVVVGGLLAIAMVVGARPALVGAMASDSLLVDQTLLRGESLVSQSGDYRLVLQLDGNLVEYNQLSQPMWYTGVIDSTADKLIFQADGNFVVYNTANEAVWSTRMAVDKPQELKLQDDGNLVAYDTGGYSYWTKSSASILGVSRLLLKGEVITSQVNGYQLVLQGDGNLVLYNAAHTAMWSAGVYGDNTRLALQLDGNLVLYNAADRAVWQSKTIFPNYRPGSESVVNGELILQADGNVVMYMYDQGRTYVIWHR